MSEQSQQLDFSPEDSLRLLTMISENILKEQNLPDAFSQTLDAVVSAYNASLGEISIIDPKGESLWITAASGSNIKIKKRTDDFPAIAIGEAVAGQTFEKKQIMIFKNLENDHRFSQQQQQFYRKNDLNTAVGIPLVYEDKPVGVLSLFFVEHLSFSHEQKIFFDILGKQMAIALRIAEMLRSLHRQKNRLEKLATHDGLTNLANHRAIQIFYKKSLQEANRYQKPLTIMLADIDHFKQVNDAYGHLFGDKILKKIARVFRSEIRGADTVGRYGGEEFLFILPETISEDGKKLAERIRKRVSELKFREDGEKVSITISIGLSSLDTGLQLTKDQFLDQADKALYKAKTSGRNRCIHYKELEN